MNLAGAPAHTWPLGTTVPGGTSAPAATTDLLSTCVCVDGARGGSVSWSTEGSIPHAGMPRGINAAHPLQHRPRAHKPSTEQRRATDDTKKQGRTLAPSMIVAPMPTTTQSAMVAAWMVAPGPIVTLLPMVVGMACQGAGRGGEGADGGAREAWEWRPEQRRSSGERRRCPGFRRAGSVICRPAQAALRLAKQPARLDSCPSSPPTLAATLCLATWITTFSCTLVFSPMLTLLTSPAQGAGCRDSRGV